MKPKLLLIISFLLSFTALKAQQKTDFISFINTQHDWVDSVYNTLTPKQRIAQLFMVRAHTNLGQAYIDSVARVIKKQQLGGIVLFQGGPVRHANLINQYQQLSRVPLWVAMDGEWGLGMRMPDSTMSFPYQMTLGAIQDDSLIYQMGQEIAHDFKRLGIQINFAPVVDINNNPRNPVINYRSFGENKDNVTRKASAYMKGMMETGIISSLKHFPGHGDTDVDSHHELPKLPFSQERLRSLEFYPFQELINEGASGVMVAHLSIPSLDDTPNLPSSLSKPTITGILKQELGFQGLTFTDAMDMKGVVKYFPEGEADIRAIIAGNDILEISENSRRAIKMVRKAIRKKRIDKQEIEVRIKKILAAKYWLELDKPRAINIQHLYEDLHRPKAMELNQRLADNAITLLINQAPVNNLNSSLKTAIISVGNNQPSEFQEALKTEYTLAMNFILPGNASLEDIENMKTELTQYDQILLALHDPRSRPASVLPYNKAVMTFISEISSKSIVCLFANPYTLLDLPGIENAKSLLIAYQNDNTLQKAVAKVILHKIKANGKLPVSVNAIFEYGDGL